MKKIKLFFKQNRKEIRNAVLLVVSAAIVYQLAHNAATVERGYVAYGGEIFIPFLIIFAKDIWAMIKEPFELLRKEN